MPTINGFTTTKPLNEQLKGIKVKLPFSGKNIEVTKKPDFQFVDKNGKDVEIKKKVQKVE